MSLAELVVGMAIIAILTTMAAPVTAHAIDEGRARDAAGFVASRLRLARQQAVFQSTFVALLFDRIGGRWTFRVCADGNGNGVRRAEVTSGADACTEGPYDVARMFPGVGVVVDSTLPGPDGDASSSDPVRFGSSDVASFSPEGTGSAGSLFLQSQRGTSYVVRMAGVTGRTRILRYDPGSRQWQMN